MGCNPQRACGDKRLYSAVPPPRCFIAAAVDLSVMRAAYRHREPIADLATERTGLRKTQLMRIRRTPTANQAELFDDMPDLVAITDAAWFREHRDALIDLCCPGLLLGQAQIGASLCAHRYLAANASSICRASAADNWFFVQSSGHADLKTGLTNHAYSVHHAMHFDWDEAKNQRTLKVRGFSFECAARIFLGPTLGGRMIVARMAKSACSDWSSGRRHSLRRLYRSR